MSKALQALHSSATPEHGTPPEYVEAARRVLGGIWLDPASSEVFNQVVQAQRYYTKEDDGLTQEWRGTVYLNPPGDRTGSLVKRFWSKLMEEYRDGNVTAAVYAGFSIDQLQTLQNTEPGGPLGNRFPICIPKVRPCWVTSLEAGPQKDLFLPDADPTPVVGENPTKPSFFCLLPDYSLPTINREMCLHFADAFSKFGEVRL